MKLQNIYVNGRYEHTINYDSLNNDIERFIIERSEPNKLKLFTLKSKNLSYIIETEEGAKEYAIEGEILESSVDGVGNNAINEVTLKLKFKSRQNGQTNNAGNLRRNHGVAKTEIAKTDKYKLLCNNVRLNVSGEINEYNVISLEMLNVNCGAIKISAIFESDNISRTLEIYAANPNEIVDVMLDFGSEATQMAVISRSNSISVNEFTNIFSSIKDRYEAPEDETANLTDYYQYEPGNEKLFRSYSLVKKEFSCNDVSQILDDVAGGINGNGTTLLPVQKVLFTKQFYNENKGGFIVAPNVKLSGFGGVELPSVKVGNERTPINRIGGFDCFFLYRRSMALFLSEALSQTEIQQSNILVNERNPRFVSFHILMPNVYKHSDVIKILRLLQKDIDNIIEKNEELKHVVKGFEVTAVSESDASIMGALAWNRSQNMVCNPGNYLLLDAGKGTLDFSLVKCTFEEGTGFVYKNIWRTGIIGAGNSLTYAYLLALLAEYINKESTIECNEDILKTVLYEKCIQNVDVRNMLDLMRAVEYYKSKPFENAGNLRERSDDDPIKSIEDINIETFTQWICNGIDGNKSKKIENGQEYIVNMIDSLVNNIMNEIDRMQNGRNANDRIIDGVIYAGRAFLLNEFKHKLNSQIKEKYGEGGELHEISFTGSFSAVTMKNVCLLCSPVIKSGRYSRKLVSPPVVCSPFAGDAPNEAPIVIQCEYEKEDWIDKLIRFFKRSKKTEQTHESTWIGYSTLKDMMANSEDGKSQLEGTKINITSPAKENLCIGGQIFSLSGLPRGSYDAFFDGEKYLLRGQNGGEFYFDNPDYDLTTSPFAQSSLFPNIDVTDAHSVMLIPKVKLNENNPINNNPSTSETEDDLENKNRSEDNERNLDNSPEPEEKIIQTGREELDTFDINI